MDPRSHFVQIPGIRLHYVDWGGNGPPLVMLHGGRMTSHSWDAVARQLSKDFRVIAMDSRGHGDSDKPARGYAYSQRVADFDAFLDALKLDHPFGMGHSAGALCMGYHASMHPGRLQRIVLIEPPLRSYVLPAPGAPSPPPTPERPRRNTPANQRRVWPSQAEMERHLRNHRQTSLWREDVFLDVAKHAFTVHEDGSVEMKWSPDVYNAVEAVSGLHPLMDEASKVTAPMLLIYGTRGIANEKEYKAYLIALAEAELVVVEGAGHNIYMEDPDVVAAAVRPFLKSAVVPSHEVVQVTMRSGRLLASGVKTSQP